MKHICLALAVLMLLWTPAQLGAQNFRVRSMSTLVLDSKTPDTHTIDIGYNDAVGIVFSENPVFLRAVEIEVRIPREILRYQNSMAYGVYRKVRPVPREGVIDYSGIQESYQPLPSRLSFVLQIPLIREHKLKTGPYATVLERVHDPKDGPVVFRLQPVMKGLPPTIEELQFQIRVKPLLTEEGALTVKLHHPGNEKKPVRILVNEQPESVDNGMLLLPPGNHHISVVSDHYRNEVRMFAIESARITTVDITLQDTAPTLILVAPDNTTILVNDKEISDTREPMVIEPGAYTILFRIGDYEVVRQITAEKGKDYTVSMHIDINVSESP